MSNFEMNIYELDAAYRPFPSFEEWQSAITFDATRWERYNNSLNNAPKPTPEVLARAREAAKRAAAMDTGAIEGLYEVDRGFTFTVAFEAAAWEAALAQKGEQVKSLFEAQLHAYDYVLDLGTKSEPISEAAIRVLHEQVCSAQRTYRVVTAVGPQEQPLPKGQYKILPNHVRTRKGTNHSYAPVDVAPAEMARLVRELRSDAFQKAHPVVQASYAHYGLVVIHPFADGNGRVARALASAFTYRAISMPIVILSEQKDIYLDSLESADNGNYQKFVEFMLESSLDTIQLVDESIRSGSFGVEKYVGAIKRLYVTKGGYTQDQVDQAGATLFDHLISEVQKVVSGVAIGKIKGNVNVLMGHGGGSTPTHRPSTAPAKKLQIIFNTPEPATAAVKRVYGYLLPRDAAGDDDIQIRGENVADEFTARIGQVLGGISGVLQIRLTMFAERIVGQMLNDLNLQAEKSLRR